MKHYLIIEAYSTRGFSGCFRSWSVKKKNDFECKNLNYTRTYQQQPWCQSVQQYHVTNHFWYVLLDPAHLIESHLTESHLLAVWQKLQLLLLSNWGKLQPIFDLLKFLTLQPIHDLLNIGMQCHSNSLQKHKVACDTWRT